MSFTSIVGPQYDNDWCVVGLCRVCLSVCHNSIMTTVNKRLTDSLTDR